MITCADSDWSSHKKCGIQDKLSEPHQNRSRSTGRSQIFFKIAEILQQVTNTYPQSSIEKSSSFTCQCCHYILAHTGRRCSSMINREGDSICAARGMQGSTLFPILCLLLGVLCRSQAELATAKAVDGQSVWNTVRDGSTPFGPKEKAIFMPTSTSTMLCIVQAFEI